jgi:HemY protein
VVLARAAIDAFDWPAARIALAPYASSDPSQAVCTLMAEIEEGQNGDQGKAREWLSRAVHAPRDPAWTADGVVSSEWEPVSPVTGRLDAFAWKQPVASLPARPADHPANQLVPASPIQES